MTPFQAGRWDAEHGLVSVVLCSERDAIQRAG
jgi:hypothetical protein